MTVHYASNYDDADELIEELIAQNNVPRSLLVVSSDHRIQRAARRRRAQFVDSDIWFADLERRRQKNRRSTPRLAKPQGSLSPDEIGYWLAEFGGAADADEPPAAPTRSEQPRPIYLDDDQENPFPPGYGEDLLEEP
jgi:hypothetical protein